MIKTAFITGAASGIGKATAEALYQQGWILGLADLNKAGLESMSTTWDQQRVYCYQLDVTNPQQCQDVIGDFTAHHQEQLSLLFNCAGILHIEPMEKIPPQRHQQIFDINVMGIIHCCQAAFNALKKTPDAQVINMSSAAATYGIPLLASYSASKFAVRGLTQALRIEWEDYGIEVGDIMPPLVNTNMLQSQDGLPPVMEKLGSKIDANDVTQEVLKQIRKAKTHRAVSPLFKTLYFLSEFSPTVLTGFVIRLLHRH